MGDVTTVKYVRKPLYVEAVQVTEENFLDVLNWANGDLGVIREDQSRDIIPMPEGGNPDPAKHYIRIRVNNPGSPRQTMAHVSDWVLYTEKGYKIYTDKAFKNNFDAVEENKTEAAA